MSTKRNKPSHRCKVCGALWRLWSADPLPDAAWSLCSPTCGTCCDNVAMGDQIEPLPPPPRGPGDGGGMRAALRAAAGEKAT